MSTLKSKEFAPDFPNSHKALLEAQKWINKKAKKTTDGKLQGFWVEHIQGDPGFITVYYYENESA